MAVIEHEGRDDRWSLSYDDAWLRDAQAFPLSPVLPLGSPAQDHPSPAIRRFIEHLLPEGRALDVALAYNGLVKSNVFGLILALGAETAGALSFTTHRPSGAPPDADPVAREITLAELDQRIAQRHRIPLSVWDGKVRMSVAGLQDKLLVYQKAERLFLVEGHRLASTHLLKPDPADERTPHLAINEHFCMSLAALMGLPVAQVKLLRTPKPVLVVKRFDRTQRSAGADLHDWVQRLHIIDACQACDLPVSYKYERNLGSAAEVRHIRDGVSFERLFACVEMTANKVAARLTLLRWALFQFLIGNTDAHGKNFSFFVRPGGLLEPAPWYDLVSVLQYNGFETELAMAWGDVFSHGDVSPYALADFATRCRIDRKVMRREGQRLAKLAQAQAQRQADSDTYLGQERGFVQKLAGYVQHQALRLSDLVGQAANVKADYL